MQICKRCNFMKEQRCFPHLTTSKHPHHWRTRFITIPTACQFFRIFGVSVWESYPSPSLIRPAFIPFSGLEKPMNSAVLSCHCCQHFLVKKYGDFAREDIVNTKQQLNMAFLLKIRAPFRDLQLVVVSIPPIRGSIIRSP